MIWVRGEGERIRQGFNFYHWNDLASRGFILRIVKYDFRCRYSYKLKRLLLSISKNVDGYLKVVWSNYHDY